MKVTAIFYRNEYWYEIQIHKTNNRIELIKTHACSKWSNTSKKWLFPINEASRMFLKSIARQQKKEVTFIILKGNRLRITCHPTQEGIEFIKSLSYYYYNSDYKHWTIPYTETNTDKLESILEKQYKINYIDNREKRAKKSCITKVLREHQSHYR